MINSLIEDENKKYQQAQFYYEKLNYKSNIIQLKKLNENGNKDLSIYGDIKEFLDCYVKSYEERAFGYYEINEQKIVEKLSLVDRDQRVAILNYFLRKLKEAGLEQESAPIQRLYKLENINLCLQNFSLSKFFKLLFYLSTFNGLTLFASIILIYIIYALILLPAPSWGIILFNSEFSYYSENRAINHLLNAALSFCDIDSDFKLTPVNFGGVVVLIFTKLTIFILILGFLSEELKRKLSI